MSYANNLRPEEVNDAASLARFCQEQTGIPYPGPKHMNMLKQAITKFFEAYPEATYTSLTNLVKWSKNKNRRYATVGNLVNGGLRYAYMDGYLPELDPRTKRGNIDELIDEALRQEQDPQMRNALMGAWTEAAKETVYKNWLTKKESV